MWNIEKQQLSENNLAKVLKEAPQRILLPEKCEELFTSDLFLQKWFAFCVTCFRSYLSQKENASKEW